MLMNRIVPVALTVLFAVAPLVAQGTADGLAGARR